MTDDASQQAGTKPEGTKPEGTDAPENLEDLDLTPAGLANEPAEQEDPDSLVEPENS